MNDVSTLDLPTGASLHVERSGTGPPVVLIHGNFVSLGMWRYQQPLADSFDLIRYDIRGFGRSPLGGGRYSDEADLAALLDALDLDAAHLVGSSYGGGVALDFAIRYPERTRSMVIVPGGLSGWDAPAWMNEGWQQFETAVAGGDFARASEVIMAFPPMRPLEARPALRQQIAEMIENHRWHEYGGPVEYDSLDPPAIRRLGDANTPALILSGSVDDPAFLALGDRMAAEMPNAERRLIEGGSHMFNMELPAEFNAAVTEFVERQEQLRADT